MNFTATAVRLLIGIAVVTAILAAVITGASKDRGGAGLRRGRYIFALVVVLLTTICVWLGLYFASRMMNLCAALVVAVAYCYFSFASFAIRPKLLGIVAGSTLVAPLILTVGTLPFAGLALGFILYDANVPYTETATNDGMICRTREYGMAASDEGQEVELLRPIYGLAYRKVFSTTVSYRTSAQTHGELCAFASTQWRLSSK